MGMDVSAIVNKWGAQYVNEGQTAKDIKKKLFTQPRTASFFRRIPEENTIYKSSYATMDSTLQAMTEYYHSKGTLTFTPHEIALGEFKINQTVKPDTLKKSWLGFLLTIAEKDRSKWPIIRWIISEMLIPQAKEEFEENVAFRGWKLTGFQASMPTVSGATFVRELASADAELPANASMDGIRTQIIRWEDEGRITPISTGAPSVTATTWVGQVEAFIASIPLKVRKKIDYVWMDETLFNRYKDGVREKYNKYHAQNEDITLVVNSNVRVNWLDGQSGSTKIWATPAMNRVNPFKDANSGRFQVEGQSIYDVLMATDWMELLTFDVPEFIYTNDQENAITAGDITAYYS